MPGWFGMAVGAAVFYGLHQVFTKLASKRIGDGIGGFAVEATAALTIGAYMLYLWLSGKWDQPASAPGYLYAVLTGVCVGAGTVLFFVMFQREAPLSVVPAVLAVDSGIMRLPASSYSGSRSPGRSSWVWLCQSERSTCSRADTRRRGGEAGEACFPSCRG